MTEELKKKKIKLTIFQNDETKSTNQCNNIFLEVEKKLDRAFIYYP